MFLNCKVFSKYYAFFIGRYSTAASKKEKRIHTSRIVFLSFCIKIDMSY